MKNKSSERNKSRDTTQDAQGSNGPPARDHPPRTWTPRVRCRLQSVSQQSATARAPTMIGQPSDMVAATRR
eukprot:3787964-Pyramimonas_sp.AAC.1